MGTLQSVNIDYHEIYENSPCGYFSYLSNGSIIEGNNTFFNFLGLNSSEVIEKKTINDILSIGSRLFFETNISPKLLIEGQVKEINLELSKKDNSKLPVLFNAKNVLNENGDYLYTRALIFNISKRKEYELELLKAKKLADDLLATQLLNYRELENQAKLILNQKKELEKLNELLLQKNDELKIKDHNHNLFFNSSLAFLSTHDLEGNLTSWNEAFSKILGYTHDELINGGLQLFIKNDNINFLKDYFIEIKQSKVVSGETKLICKDGSEKYIFFQNVLETNSDGNHFVVSNAIDITEKRHLIAELNKTKDLLQKSSKIAKLGGWEYNMYTKVLYWSDTTKEIHEVPNDYEPNVENAIKFYKEGVDRERIKHVFNNAIQHGTPWDEEFQIITAKGKTIWVKAHGHAEMNNGVCEKILGTLQDIDEKKRAEIEVKNSQKLLRDVLDAATEVGIIATDKNGVITLFNKGSEKLLGDKASDMVGRFAPEVLRHVEEEVITRAKQLTEELGHSVEGFQIFTIKAEMGVFETVEWTYLNKDGSSIIVEMTITLIRDHQNNIVGYLAFFVNISELKKAKKELEINAEKLQDQNERLLNFAHIASHNLRSPVSNLNSLLYFYKESTSIEDKELLFTKFEKVLNHLTETLSELIESIKIQGAKGLNKENVSFVEVYEKASEILAGQIMETKAKVSFEFSKAPLIYHHKAYLDSIILNLFSNAIKYRSPDRIPEIQFETNIINNKVILLVKDNGLGLDLKKHGSKLFGLHKTFHRNPEAKGFGLFMSKAQVEAMGGRITVESEVDKGSIFKIEF